MGTTRFICTIGPKTLDKKWLDSLHEAGMCIARVNGAHGSLDDVRNMILSLKEDLPEGVEILLDLPGNKIRTDNIEEPIPLKTGETFVIKPEQLTYRPLYQILKVGHGISAADGTIQLEVTKIDGEDIVTRVLVGGDLANRKGINVRGIHEDIPFDFERDIKLLNIAMETGIHYVGLSFVRKGEHVRRMQAQLLDTGIRVVAKVETAEAVQKLDSILDDADIIMIDRGDLEAEIDKENVPLTQKTVIKRANERDVPVIVASQFLLSMMDKPLPHMSEVSDIANAVLDGANILMLSEETAIGEYPVECIATMSRIARTVEERISRQIGATILIAGPSTGFGSLTTNKHKSMLDVGGTTIIAHQLKNMMLSGIESEDVTMVTGFAHKQVSHYLRAEGFEGKFSFNPWYQTTNMATSLWLSGLPERTQILCYGDIIFEPSILDDLVATEGDIVLVVDRRGDFDAEDEKVVLENDLVVQASKDISNDETHGEFIGLAKLTPRGARILWDELDETVRQNDMMAFLSEVLGRIAAKGTPINVCYTQGRAWNDNDTLDDLSRSRESVYPRIREARSTTSDTTQKAK